MPRLGFAWLKGGATVAEYYKFEIANWDEGTALLTLEQEAAYLRVINAIRLKDQPLTFNMFALCGIWRCNERKAKRLLAELIEAGKLRIDNGKIVNDKAVEDASNLRRLRVERQSAGSRGGVESAKARAKSLETKETAQASASTREEKRREEYSEAKASGADAPIDPVKIMFDSGRSLLTAAGRSADAAGKLLGKWRNEYGTEAVIAALGQAQREGAIEPVSYIEGILRGMAKKLTEPRQGDERTTPDGRRQVFIGTGWITEA
jgi:hypothetical protein